MAVLALRLAGFMWLRGLNFPTVRFSGHLKVWKLFLQSASALFAVKDGICFNVVALRCGRILYI